MQGIEWAKALTRLLPITSAIFPLTSAPNIPPAVSIEPKTEYCTVRLRKKAESELKTQKCEINKRVGENNKQVWILPINATLTVYKLDKGVELIAIFITKFQMVLLSSF